MNKIAKLQVKPKRLLTIFLCMAMALTVFGMSGSDLITVFAAGSSGAYIDLTVTEPDESDEAYDGFMESGMSNMITVHVQAEAPASRDVGVKLRFWGYDGELPADQAHWEESITSPASVKVLGADGKDGALTFVGSGLTATFVCDGADSYLEFTVTAGTEINEDITFFFDDNFLIETMADDADAGAWLEISSDDRDAVSLTDLDYGISLASYSVSVSSVDASYGYLNDTAISLKDYCALVQKCLTKDSKVTGTTYSLGSWDCSAFVQYFMNYYVLPYLEGTGIDDLPKAAQNANSPRTTINFASTVGNTVYTVEEVYKAVQKSNTSIDDDFPDMMPGDILLFGDYEGGSTVNISHIAVYLGDFLGNGTYYVMENNSTSNSGTSSVSGYGKGDTGVRLQAFRMNTLKNSNSVNLVYIGRLVKVTTTGYLSLKKTSSNTDITDSNGNYSLNGAKYGVYTNKACTTLAKDADGNNAYLMVKANGSANTLEMEPGTFYVKEISAPEGYALDTGVYTVEVTGDETEDNPVMVNSGTVSDDPKSDTVDILLGKIDDDSNAARPQGSASLAGAQFTVRYYDGYYTSDPDKSGIKAVRTWVFETDENGRVYLTSSYKISGSDLYYNSNHTATLPLGTVTIQETKAPEGYLLNDEMIIKQITDDGGNTESVYTYNKPTVSDQVIRGGVMIRKTDLESGESYPEGGADLSGAEFKITNLSNESVKVDGSWYATGEVVKTITSYYDDKLEAYVAGTDSDTLPYGIYSITEVTAPKGYLLGENDAADDAKIARIFKVSEEGIIVDLTNEDDSIADRVKRGDISFVKKDTDNNLLAYVPFRITSMTTNESHIVYTDEDGYYNSASSYRAHSVNTNEDGFTTDENGDTRSNGLWFGLDSDGNNVPADDSLGALPYDTYFIEELECDANEGKKLVSFYYNIHKEDGYLYEIDDIIDYALDYDTPQISTSAKDEDTGTRYGMAEPGVTIIDTLTYSNMTYGDVYTIRTKLWDKTTGDYVTDSNGDDIEVVTILKASSTIGTIDTETTFDATGLDGHDVVVFEYVYYPDGKLAVSHEDETDTNQTIHFPGIGTTAVGADTLDHITKGTETTTIVDTVEYRNLQPGKKYTVRGTLYNKETGEPIAGSDGNAVTAETSFTAQESSGTVDVTFTFDASSFKGESIVAGEKVYLKDIEYAAHYDMTDEGQTVKIPEIHTSASDLTITTEDGEEVTAEDSKVVNYDEGTITVKDVVDYHNLIAGYEYTISGMLMDKATGGPLTDADGNPVTASRTFIAAAEDGKVTICFTVDTSVFENSSATLVVFESLALNGVEIAEHRDITDIDQTVYIPGIGTSLIDSVTKEHISYARDEQTLIDTVEYHDLYTGYEYNLKGVLMDRETGEALVINGEEVAAEMKFTPEESDGTIELEFTFDATGLEDHDVVAYEYLYLGVYLAASHTDITDEDQTVHFPGIKTYAVSDDTGTQMMFSLASVRLTDNVYYSNLIPGYEYEVTGIAYILPEDADTVDPETDEPLVINGEPVTSTVTFTPSESDGVVEVPFEIDASTLAGQTIVFFEDITLNGSTIVREHLNDPEQEISFIDASIKTTASETDTGNKDVEAGEVSITDVIEYTGLIPGLEYRVSGTLMDKKTGEAIDGAVAEAEFTPDEEDGTVSVVFEVDASELEGHTLVAFEELAYESSQFDDGSDDDSFVIAEHKDFDDEAQSVTVKETVKENVEETNPSVIARVKTGDYSKPLALGIIIAAAAAVIIVIAVRRRKKLN